MTEQLIPPRGVYPKEIKTYAHAKTFIQVLTETLLSVAKSWQQPKCPSEGEWVNALVRARFLATARQ